MSRKGRNGRSRKSSSVAPAGAQVEVQTSSPPPEAVAPPMPAPEDEPGPARARSETPVAFAAHDLPEGAERDDASVPPVDIDNHFFERPARLSDPPAEVEDRDPRMAMKMTAMAARRRAHLAKYVKIAVGLASAVCLAALVKVAVARGDSEGETRRPAAASQGAPQAPVAPVQTAIAPAQPPAAPQETAAPPAAAAVPADTATAAPTPTEGAPAPAAPAATDATNPAPEATAAPELDPKAAAKEKSACRAALERGKLADSIEAGERSVALDPTDGEAWLILGAAYQEKGDMKNARRSYKACIEQGKRGPRYECMAMPH
jgi:Flp pilus assembly protein TadD